MIFQSYIRKWSIRREGGRKRKSHQGSGRSVFVSLVSIDFVARSFCARETNTQPAGCATLWEYVCVQACVCVWLYVEQGQVRHCMDSQISRATRKQKNSAYRVAEHLFYNFFSYWWKNKIKSQVESRLKAKAKAAPEGSLRLRREVWRGGMGQVWQG